MRLVPRPVNRPFLSLVEKSAVWPDQDSHGCGKAYRSEEEAVGQPAAGHSDGTPSAQSLNRETWRIILQNLEESPIEGVFVWPPFPGYAYSLILVILDWDGRPDTIHQRGPNLRRPALFLAGYLGVCPIPSK